VSYRDVVWMEGRCQQRAAKSRRTRVSSSIRCCRLRRFSGVCCKWPPISAPSLLAPWLSLRRSLPTWCTHFAADWCTRRRQCVLSVTPGHLCL